MLLRKPLVKRTFLLLFTVFAFNLNAKLSPEAESALKEIEWGSLSIIEQIKFKANFASNFEVVEWGCGAPCTQSVIIELESGIIIDFLDSCYGLKFTIESNVIEFLNIENDPLESCNNLNKLKLINGKLVPAT